MSDCAEVTLTPARLAVVAFALSIVGLTAPADAYLALVAPGDAESRQKQVADESDCMLVGLGIEEAVFLVPPRAPYVEGSAPRLLEARAKGYPWAPDGALRPVTPDAPPGTSCGGPRCPAVPPSTSSTLCRSCRMGWCSPW